MNWQAIVTLAVFGLNGLLAFGAFFAVLWIRGQQRQLDELRAFKDGVLSDYVRRNEVGDMRAEMLALLRDIDAKVSKLYDKLEKKEDRS